MQNKTLNSAKKILLANYIFGGNSDNTQIDMTSPVIYKENFYAFHCNAK